MNRLMRSVSGIRGIVGESLTPETIVSYVNAFIRLQKAKHLVVGRDSRPTGPMIEKLVAATCSAAGCKCTLAGLSSTPTVEMLVPHLHADGGIIITASHNPEQWNALKFLDSKGEFPDEQQVAKLFALVDDSQTQWQTYQNLGEMDQIDGGDDYHIEEILKLPYLDIEKIKSRKFKVACDCVNGAGSFILPNLLKRLGCEVTAIHHTPDGTFPRNPEPTAQGLAQFGPVVSENNCDIGFALDPDADRMALADEKGTPLSEEYTLALSALLILQKDPGPVTVNLSTSRMIEDIANNYGVGVFRAKVGEINVSTKMKENKSVLGGEGNGGVILPKLHYGRDGILAAALILQLLAEKKQKLSEIIQSIPSYHIEKRKFSTDPSSLANTYGRLLAKYGDAKADQTDGLRLSWENSWIHARPSNTEPVVRVIAEAPHQEQAVRMCNEVIKEFQSSQLVDKGR